jgi:hypothetical protein
MSWFSLIWNNTMSLGASPKQPGKRTPVCKRRTFLAVEALESRLVPSTAVAANDFLNSLGINFHISQGVSEASYESLFNYTGIRNARDLGDSGRASSYVTLHNHTGVLFDIFAGTSGNVADLLSTGNSLASVGGLLSFEGPNEPNNFPITYNGQTGGGPSGTWLPVAQYQSAIYSQVKGDSTLMNYPVFGVSLGGAEINNVGLQFLTIPTGAGTLMPDGTQYADYANPHDYLIPFDASQLANNEAWGASDPLVTGPWDGLYREYGVTWRQHFAGYSNDQLSTLPRVTTETGWPTGDGTNRTISEDQQGKLYLNTYLDFYKQGWTHTFIYQMRDNEGGPANTWGIYHANSTPKSAATDIHNLTTILADNTSNTPTSLNYSIPNEPATVHDMLMQKSDGTFYLAVWDERVVGTGSDNVTVNLGGTYSAVDVYDPTVGTSVLQQLNNVSSVTLSLGDHPLILAIPRTAGPSVISSTPAGNTFGVVNDVRVTFDEAIDPSTFTLGQVVSFTHTDSSGATDLRPTLLGVTPVAGSGGRQFDISFVSQFNLGDYALTFGPDILDLNGRPMDQNHNGIAGEVPDDEYTAAFTIQGPMVVASSVTAGTNFLPDAFSSVVVTFNEPINSTTFTTDEVHFADANGSIDLSGLTVTPVTGSNNTQFRIQFAPFITTGAYVMTVGPNIRDLYGHRMDQNGDFIEGEDSDVYTLQFGVQGLRVLNSTVINLDGFPVDLRVTYNEPVDASTLTPDQVLITAPDGSSDEVLAVLPVRGSNFTQFDILFRPATAAGTYALVIGPYVQDVFGNYMDQNNNLIAGENPDDAYTTSFTVAGPEVISTTLTGTLVDTRTTGRFVFDRPMDVTTFTTDQFQVTGPGGVPVPVTAVTAVPYTNNTQFDISLVLTSGTGTYMLQVGPNLKDVYGDVMEAPFTGTFTVVS